MSSTVLLLIIGSVFAFSFVMFILKRLFILAVIAALLIGFVGYGAL